MKEKKTFFMLLYSEGHHQYWPAGIFLHRKKEKGKKKYFPLYICDDALFVTRLKHFFLWYKHKHQAVWDIWDFPHAFWLLTNYFSERLPDIYYVPRASNGLDV